MRCGAQFQQVHLIFWDLGGQAGLRSIWDKYYAESNALIYLIDASAGPGRSAAGVALSFAARCICPTCTARDCRFLLYMVPLFAMTRFMVLR